MKRELKVVRPATLRSNFGLYEILVAVKSAHMAKVGALRRATRPLHSHLNSEPLHEKEKWMEGWKKLDYPLRTAAPPRIITSFNELFVGRLPSPFQLVTDCTR